MLYRSFHSRLFAVLAAVFCLACLGASPAQAQPTSKPAKASKAAGKKGKKSKAISYVQNLMTEFEKLETALDYVIQKGPTCFDVKHRAPIDKVRVELQRELTYLQKHPHDHLNDEIVHLLRSNIKFEDKIKDLAKLDSELRKAHKKDKDCDFILVKDGKGGMKGGHILDIVVRIEKLLKKKDSFHYD